MPRSQGDDWGDTTVLHEAAPPARHQYRPRRRVFPHGWQDFLYFAWSLPGLAFFAILVILILRLRGH
jgi:hypothetical protein